MDNLEQHRSIVGSLQYLTITRPDISFEVNCVCQHMHMPLEDHYNDVKRILRYIKGTTNYGIQFHKGSTKITAFSNADQVGDAQDRRSTGGYCVYLGNNIVSWYAKKQPTMDRSSIKAEYKSLANTASEVLWIIQLMKYLKKFDDNSISQI